MTYDPENIFAKILRGEIPNDTVHEDEHVLAFRDINPQAQVHILIIPKGAYVSYADFSQNASEEEITALVRVTGKLAQKLGIRDSGFRLITNAGHNAHQDVPHFHVHLLGGNALGPMIARR